MVLLEQEIKQLKSQGKEVLSGQSAFKLYDTFGFPLDLTKDILEEEGLLVDENVFTEEMKIQKQRARSARLDKEIHTWSDDPFEYLESSILTKFVGYDILNNTSEVIAMVKEGIPAQRVTVGDEVLLLLKETPFYAESGGQSGDRGQVISQTGTVEIIDCKRGSLGRHIHYGKVIEGQVDLQQTTNNTVDSKRRMSTTRNHTSTHILHKALQDVLGEHVAQAGSLVN